MSLTLLVWLILFCLLLALSFHQPAWAVALYMLTFFACPMNWDWGDPIREPRWNLFGGFAMLVGVIVAKSQRTPIGPVAPEIGALRWMTVCPALILLNATLVHLTLAENPRQSWNIFILLSKFILFYYLLLEALRTRDGLRIAILAIVLGAGYIGYEVTINDVGKFVQGRLEGVGVASGRGANSLANVMVLILPMAGALFLAETGWRKWTMLIVAPLILNVILLCNSRGCFLAAIIGAAAFLFAAPSAARKQALKLLALGGLALWLMLGDPDIANRFLTIFVEAEERDHAAQSRLDYWQAGLSAVADHPLGTGGRGFRNGVGPDYMKEFGYEFEGRSVHNGFLNEACEWGIQGFLLRASLHAAALFLLFRSSRTAQARGDSKTALLAAGVLAGQVAFLAQTMFDDLFDNEWGYWPLGMSVALARFVRAPADDPSTVRSPSPAPLEGRAYST